MSGTVIRRSPSAATNFRVLEVAAGGTLVMTDVAIRNGNTAGLGGGILSAGTRNVDRGTFSGNTAGNGGTVNTQSAGTTRLVRSTITGNTSGSLGGGLSNLGATTLTLSRVEGNTVGRRRHRHREHQRDAARIARVAQHSRQLHPAQHHPGLRQLTCAMLPGGPTMGPGSRARQPEGRATMSAGDLGAGSAPLSKDQVLDELEFLATVEHALIVECLSVHCALGHDLAAGDGGAVTQPGMDAASVASSLAQGQMFHLRSVNGALIDAGRQPQLGRATSISSASVAEIALDPPSLAQLQQLLGREEGIGLAVDERYARLAPAVTSAPVFDGTLLDELQSVIVSSGQSHAAAFAGYREALGGAAPASVLRATRRDTADDFEQHLLDASDRAYALTMEILGLQFTADPSSGVPFLQVAVQAMNILDDSTRVLVQRGMLPPFTL
ncbi:MAG: hypothetical protein ABJB47_14735 [Actinomycetota bacterium]